MIKEFKVLGHILELASRMFDIIDIFLINHNLIL